MGHNISTDRLPANGIFIPAAAALPFALSIIFHTIGPHGQQFSQAAEPPALAFDQYLVNLRDVQPSRYVFARFGFTNTSKHTVKIKQLKPSCGCLNPQLKKRRYEPNESGEFYLRVQTANEKPGPNEYFCTVLYEDIQPREVELRFKVTLPNKTVIVRPKALIFYQFGSEPTTREIVVTDYRQQQLEILGVNCSSTLAKVALGKVESDHQGQRRHKVLVTVVEVPQGRHQALVTIFTNDPEFSQLRVPLLLQGPGEKPHRLGTTLPYRSHR